ncbi:MAG TPA: hypothetical protein V6D47_04375 [Oscillatoriaceae cyanobacterium]
MHSRLAKRSFAIALVLAATGCAAQTAQAPTPHANVLRPPADSPFHAGLKAPAGAQAPHYGLQALPTSPHLIGSAFLDANNQPCAYTPNLGYNPQDNTYIAVYTEYYGTNIRVRGRIKDDHGQTQVPDFTIANYAFTTTNAKVGYLPWLNQFVVAYTKFDSSGNDVYLQRISDSGALIGPAVPISTAPGIQDWPNLAVDPINHRVEVVWEDNRSGDYDIYARLVAFNGNQTIDLTSETLVGNSAPDPDHGYQSADQEEPVVAFGTQQQRYVVAWDDFRNGHSDALDENWDIYASTLAANGVPVTSDYVVSDLQGGQYVWDIAYLASSDKFLLPFTSGNNGDADYDVLASGLDGDGSVLGWGVISNQFGVQQTPVVAANDASMTWLVGYTESVNPEAGDNLHVMGRHVGWAFQEGDIFQVSPFIPNESYPLGIAANTDDQEFLIDYSAYTLHGQQVPPSPPGAPGAPFAVPLVPQPSATPLLDLWGQRIDRGY